jgi:uncharacterized protein YwqG
MRFICQIALDSHIFGESGGCMAYLFITDDEIFGERTFDPDGGENAVIIQPGTCNIPVQPLLNGPSLYKMISNAAEEEQLPHDCEFAVELTVGIEPDSILEDEQVHTSEEAWTEFTKWWSESKIGGTPAFLQYPEYPAEGNWRLLLQLDSVHVPFYVNFGDAGIGYAFLSEDGRSGKFLWQCL